MATVLVKQEKGELTAVKIVMVLHMVQAVRLTARVLKTIQTPVMLKMVHVSVMMVGKETSVSLLAEMVNLGKTVNQFVIAPVTLCVNQ